MVSCWLSFSRAGRRRWISPANNPEPCESHPGILHCTIIQSESGRLLDWKPVSNVLIETGAPLSKSWKSSRRNVLSGSPSLRVTMSTNTSLDDVRKTTPGACGVADLAADVRVLSNARQRIAADLKPVVSRASIEGYALQAWAVSIVLSQVRSMRCRSVPRDLHACQPVDQHHQRQHRHRNQEKLLAQCNREELLFPEKKGPACDEPCEAHPPKMTRQPCRA